MISIRIFVTLILSSFLACVPTALAQHHEVSQRGFAESLDELFTKNLHAPAISGAVLAVKVNGELVHAEAIGCRQIAKTGLASAIAPKCRKRLKPSTKIRMASISKMALALGVSSLVEDDIINLDADISNYLGWRLRNPNYPDIPITTRQLLSHTSSIRDPEIYWARAPQSLQTFIEENINAFSKGGANIDDSPGKYFQYANLNSGILATIIENVSGKRFDQFMRQAVFLPLEIDAGYNWSGVAQKARRSGAILYRWQNADDGTQQWRPQTDDRKILNDTTPYFLTDLSGNPDQYLASYKPGDNGTLFSPQGGMRASVLDLLTLLTEVDQTPLLKESVWKVNSTETNGDTEEQYFSDYGFGIQTVEGDEGFLKGYRLKGHAGEAYGLYSGAWNLYSESATQKSPPIISVAFVVTGTQEIPSSGSHPGFNILEENLLRIGMSYAEQFLESGRANIASKAKKNLKHGGEKTHDEPRPYDKERDAAADVDAVLLKAKQSGKKPLLVLGANWCHDSRGLAARFEKPEFVKLINDHYELVYIDVGKRDRNLDIAERFGVFELIGTPTVLILSEDEVLLNASSVHRWRRAASISDQDTFEYFNSFAKGEIWKAPQ